MICSVHNKQRSAAMLMDCTESPGKLRCKPECECKVANLDGSAPQTNSPVASSGAQAQMMVTNQLGAGLGAEPTMCMLHGKRRSAHVLQQVQTPWGIQSHCKADSRCKEGRGNAPQGMPFPMFGGMYGYQPHMQFMAPNLQTHALCQKHHKLRLMRYLEQQGHSIVCKDESQCLLPKANGEGVTAGVTAVCSVHGKLRRIEYMKQDKATEQYTCLPEQQCKVGNNAEDNGDDVDQPGDETMQ